MRRVGAIVLVALAAGPAHAFSVSETSGHVIKWNKTSLDYYLDSVGAIGTTGTLGTVVFPSVRASVATWNAVSCNAATITELGISTGVATSLVTHESDKKNVIGWVPADKWTYGLSTLGVTQPFYYTDTGYVEDADIGLNSKIGWSMTSASGVADVESVVTHELGHYLGLQHVLGGQSFPDPPTMSPYMDPNLKTRTLTQDDMNGACFLYPGTPYTCATVDDCPLVLDKNSDGVEAYVGRIGCTGSSCQGFVTLTGAIGTLCDPAVGGCQSGFTCTAYAGAGYCTEPCTTGTCATSYTCTGVSGASVCLPTAVVKSATGTCGCDTSSRCDASCNCDPDCVSGGCAASPEGPQTSGIALLIAAFVYIYARAKRRRHGGARFARR